MTYSNGFWSADDPRFQKGYEFKDEEVKKMEVSQEQAVKKPGRYPDFKGKDGSAAWLNKGAQGEYLSVVLADKTRLTLFKSDSQEVRGV